MAETTKQISKTNRVTKEVDMGRSLIAEPNVYKSTYLGNSYKASKVFGVKDAITRKSMTKPSQESSQKAFRASYNDLPRKIETKD